MPPTLSDEQKAAVDASPGGPMPVVDDRTAKDYVLLSADKYELLMAFATEDEEADRAAWQALGLESAWRAGWNDPIMDEYYNYDDNLRKLRGERG